MKDTDKRKTKKIKLSSPRISFKKRRAELKKEEFSIGHQILDQEMY